jgi:hypothetical protein
MNRLLERNVRRGFSKNNNRTITGNLFTTKRKTK